MTDFSKQLSKYMPEAAAPIISKWINDTGCLFRISRSRTSKLGDYRPPFHGAPHRISVNHDLNPYAFLVTTIHEFAHLKTHLQYQNSVKPHGNEWKNNYKKLMYPILRLEIFPEDVAQAITKYMENPAASSCTDHTLFYTLRKHDKNASSLCTVESITYGALFAYQGNRVFQKKEKMRKRYRCLELSTNIIYFFHPIAEVVPIEQEPKSPTDT